MTKIIKAYVKNVKDDHYILETSNGDVYKIPTGTVELEQGAFLPLGDETYLEIHLPEPDSDDEDYRNDAIFTTDTDFEVLSVPTAQSPEDSLDSDNALLATSAYGIVDNMTFRSDEKKKNAKWSDRTTKLLISEYKKLKPLVDSRKIKTMKRMWEMITECLNRHTNCNYTSTQTETKWKTLERAFKGIVDNNNKSGRGKRKCPYERELADILLKKKNVVPPFVAHENGERSQSTILEESSLTPVEIADISDRDSGNSVRSSTPVTETPVVNRRNRNQDLVLLADAIKCRSEQVKTMNDRNYEQRERFIKALEERNKLLKDLIDKLDSK